VRLETKAEQKRDQHRNGSHPAREFGLGHMPKLA
jgi:hypothetical protein